LGLDFEQKVRMSSIKARVQELIELYIHCLPHTKKMLFLFADTAQRQTEEGLELMPLI
jgi:hypothetical protein